MIAGLSKAVNLYLVPVLSLTSFILVLFFFFLSDKFFTTKLMMVLRLLFARIRHKIRVLACSSSSTG